MYNAIIKANRDLLASSLFSFIGIQEYIEDNVDNEYFDIIKDGQEFELYGVTIKKLPKGFQVGNEKHEYNEFDGLDDLQGFIDGLIDSVGQRK